MKKFISIGTVLLVFMAIILRIFFIKSIPQGHVGIVYSAFGGVKEKPLGQGYKFVRPGTKITIYPIFTQQGSMNKAITDESPKNEQFQVSTNSTKPVFVDCEFSYHVDKDDVTKLYNKFGGKSIKEIEVETLKRKIPMLISNVTSNIDALTLQGGGNLAEINAQITKYCREQLKPYFITIENVTIKAEVDEASQKAIQQRMDLLQQEEQVKIQERIETTNNTIRTNRAKADKEIEKIKAETESEIIKIKAKAQADANKTISDSITSELINWKKVENDTKQIEKWNGNVPQVQGNHQLLLDVR